MYSKRPCHMSIRGRFARNAVFSYTKAASESTIAREMLCFTIERAVGGCEGRRLRRRVRLWSPFFAYSRIGPHWEV